ncbi:hypothetical protein [Acinetobacter stercoris]|uniref:Transcriptional regulator n=1 Tax=Acinetobacter stercoris TaxID=2126983 RepID=A0A2U3N4J4_9GAMM|nr:hypothetical protein [Acinetobacter stercoris]SPL72601.1 hypothetical protein KPC_3779 [Acinetobacter stercoris]
MANRLSRSTNIEPRKVKQWLSGDRLIPIGLWQEVIQLLRDNSQAALAYVDESNKKFKNPNDETSKNN